MAYHPANGWLAAATNGALPSGDGASGRASVYAPGETRPRYTVDVDGTYGYADAVAFSPNGKLSRPAAGSASFGSGTRRLVRPSAGTSKSRLAPSCRSRGRPRAVCSSRAALTARSWIIDPGTQVIDGVLPGVDNQWVDETFTPDGQAVIGDYQTGQAFEWAIAPAAWRHGQVAGRTLTQPEWEQYLPGGPYKPACTPCSGGPAPALLIAS